MAQGSRQSAIRALINIWLKLPTLSCAMCGTDYIGGPMDCCENPVICNNQKAMKVFLKELKEVRATRKNDYASNSDKSMRLGLSVPANLYIFLDMSMKRLYNQGLLTKEHDMFWFLRHFPQFQVPRKL